MATLTNADNMTSLPNFSLVRPGKLSLTLVNRGLDTFHKVAELLATLPYRRLDDPRNLSEVFVRAGSTFTARHALLVQIAREQRVTDLSLALCAYEFDRYDPVVDQILRRHRLIGLPDMCGYIKYQNRLVSIVEGSFCPQQRVVSEMEIAPVQIGNFKRRYHQKYLENWLQLEGLDRIWSVEQVWKVREECLEAVERHWNGSRQPLAA